MSSPSIDFRAIRPHGRGKEHGFEELTRQLILADRPQNAVRVENRGVGADGGVEVLVWFQDGTCWGWQSKYFIDGVGNSQIGQLRDSFETALVTYPSLTRYVVAVPRNLSGPAQGQNSTERQKWEGFRREAMDKAQTQGRSIDVDLWDESEFIRRLSRHDALHAGMRAYWFDSSLLTKAALEAALKPTLADLGERYSATDHVDVSTQSYFDTLLRTSNFASSAISSDDSHLAKALVALEAAKSDTLLPENVRAGAELACQALQSFFGRSRLIDWQTEPSIDVEALHSELEQLWQCESLDVVRKWALKRRNENHADNTTEQLPENIIEALSHLRRAQSALDIAEANLLRDKVLLVLGEAGCGKSHLLAHNVAQHIANGGPACLVLGQHISGPDPRASIIQRIGICGASFRELLAMLQAAAIAAGKPALLAIDAVNESINPEFWRGCLAGLVTEVSSFNQVALVVSCRTTYEEFCIPETVAETRIEHHGFADNSLEAAKTYLDRHGIVRPTTPFLNPEFSNPLFLSTVVKSLQRKGVKDFPVGINGISTLFDFWLESIEDALVRKGFKRIAPGDGRIKAALQRLAETLALERVESLGREQASKVVEEVVLAFPPQGPLDLLLERLIDEGVLRRDPSQDGSTENVAFTFQRFSDHFIASTILRLFDDKEALATALTTDGDFSYLTDGKQPATLGIVEALSVQVPEKLNCELLDILRPDIASKFPPRLLLESLCWRNPAASTPRTIELLEDVVQKQGLHLNHYYSLLLRLCCVEGHCLNADYLHKRLSSLSMRERDLSWSLFLSSSDGQHGLDLIEWASSKESAYASPQQSKLLATSLAWFLTTSDRRIRDQATKALAYTIWKQPSLAAWLLKRFSSIDEPYLIERLLAACLGGLLHSSDSASIIEAAYAGYAIAFGRKPLTWNAFIRRYARALVQNADRFGDANKNAFILANPPYTTPPISHWPDAEEVKALKDIAPHIFSSVVGWIAEDDRHHGMAGDFGRYTMSGVEQHFSQHLRVQGPVNRPSAEKARFWADLSGTSPQLACQSTKLREKRKELSEFFILPFIDGDLESDALALNHPRVAEWNQLRQAFEEEEKAFVASLPSQMQDQYRSRDWFPQSGDETVAKFSLRNAQRWVFCRAVELSGYSSENTERTAGGESWDRYQHHVERLGKKYQWIAWFELIGYLMDHHWFIDWQENVSILEAPDVFEQTDIDPSYFAKGPEELTGDARFPVVSLPTHDHENVDISQAMEWLETEEDIPNVPQLVEHVTRDGNRWFAIHAYWRGRDYLLKLRSTEVFRTGQGWINACLASSTQVRSMYRDLVGKDLVGESFNEEHTLRDALLGEYRSGFCPHVGTIFDSSIKAHKVGSLFRRYDAIRSEYDCSVGDDLRHGFKLPARVLLESAKLKPESPLSRVFVNENGAPAFADILRSSWTSNGLTMATADAVEAVRSQHDLTVVWILSGERDAGRGTPDDLPKERSSDRRGYQGMWWQENGKWQGSNWLSPKKWSEA